MSKILVVIDIQNDFISGSLGSENAKKMIPKLIEKINNEDENTYFIFTKDTHGTNYLTTNEGVKLPVEHCIKGAQGWEIPECITELFINMPYTIEKPTFGSTELVEYLNDLVNVYDDYDEIEFVGLVTDICVISNALLAKTYFGEKVEISVDATCCAGTTEENHNMALAIMESCQINVRR